MKSRDAVKLKWKIYWDWLRSHKVIYCACKRLCLIHTNAELKKFLVEGVTVCRKARRLVWMENVFFNPAWGKLGSVFVYRVGEKNHKEVRNSGETIVPHKTIYMHESDWAKTWNNKNPNKIRFNYSHSFLMECFYSTTYKWKKKINQRWFMLYFQLTGLQCTLTCS